MKIKLDDGFLDKYYQRNIAWISEGKIPFSSKVIPVQKSVDCLQWVLPTNQAKEIVRNARSFALQDCVCRVHYKRCDSPIDVCLLINDAADASVKNGRARYVSLEEAVEKLELANMYGLVHLTIYTPDQHVFALCSCCACCCHELQIMKISGRLDMTMHSDYIAEVDTSKCTKCGICADRCVFGAQVKKETHAKMETVEYHEDKCYGCGLCLTTCPSEAISLVLRKRV